jgi:hypothetical protein
MLIRRGWMKWAHACLKLVSGKPAFPFYRPREEMPAVEPSLSDFSEPHSSSSWGADNFISIWAQVQDGKVFIYKAITLSDDTFIYLYRSTLRRKEANGRELTKRAERCALKVSTLSLRSVSPSPACSDGRVTFNPWRGKQTLMREREIAKLRTSLILT